MLRSFLIYLSKAGWARNMVTRWAFAWRAASRFVAGDKLEDGIRAVQRLNALGINATLDHLGEHTTNSDEAYQSTEDILEALEAISKAGVRSNFSIKLTQIGLAVDQGLCEENLIKILKRAKGLGNFVRIDMEDSPWVDATLDLYHKMRVEHGLDNTGVVIQSYLYRSEGDVRQLNQDCTRIRLCKGAYKEPPEIAYPKKGDVDASYDRLARLMMENSLQAGCPQVSEDGLFPPTPALATHDPRRVDYAVEYVQQSGLPKKSVEFQMLYGIRRDLQENLAKQGFPVRVYVPYGTQWYAYYVRRLAERPANLWFFISNFLRP
ncbi:MAG: proline dehydrogenase family protein [Anaerolineales bacterium]|nr:MAG: proline dehydrogenase family protein [Anaerolineales bacterium]